jgi:hypothetical protein
LRSIQSGGRKKAQDRRRPPGLACILAMVQRFTEAPNRSRYLFRAIPDGKPLRTFLELL